MEEAGKRYEELVRAHADIMDDDEDGFVDRVTKTDVDGVPGPLPELPEVTASDLYDLLDADQDAALVLAVADEDSAQYLELKTGPIGDTNPAHIVVTRARLLYQLGLDTAPAQIDDYLHSEVGRTADEREGRVRAAADDLLPNGI